MQSRSDSEKTYYVLVPLPSKVRSKCTADNSYVEKEGCDNQRFLSKENFDDLMKVGQTLITRIEHNSGRHVHHTVLTFEDSETLKKLKPNDILYISAHGSPRVIGTKKEGISLTPADLAVELKKNGLNPELETLKVMACDSAINRHNVGVYGNSDSKPNVKNVGKSYIQSLRLEMKRKGYKKLDIAGYLGEVNDAVKAKQLGELHSFVKFSDSGNANIRARYARIWSLSPATKRDTEEIMETNKENVELLKTTNK